MAFTGEFQARAIPALRRAVAVQGLFVAIGCRSWAEGYDAVHALAIARGALHLPDRTLARLEDWIASALLARIDAVTPAWHEQQALGAKVAADIAATGGWDGE